MEHLTRKICSYTPLIVGIDPGTMTGVAIRQGDVFVTLACFKIHKAMRFLEDVAKAYPHLRIKANVEDARLNKLFKGQYNSKEANAKRQGVGSVKRDSKIWEDFLFDLKKECANVEYTMIAAVNGRKLGMTKSSQKQFETIVGYEYPYAFINLPLTGYQIKRKNIINHHTRDGAMIAYTHQ